MHVVEVAHILETSKRIRTQNRT